jgi:hypothetical protein
LVRSYIRLLMKLISSSIILRSLGAGTLRCLLGGKARSLS